MLRGSATFGLALLAGCYLSHSHGEPDASPPVDAGDAAVDAAPDALLDACSAAIATLATGAPAFTIPCDPITFPRHCSIALDRCCGAQITCFDEANGPPHLERTIGCSDACGGCRDHDFDLCLLDPFCEQFAPGACGSAPSGVIEGPACIERRLGSCDGNAPCLAPHHCVPFWIDPCAGLPCDACGAVQDYCVP